jgi:chromosome segregation ATPase
MTPVAIEMARSSSSDVLSRRPANVAHVDSAFVSSDAPATLEQSLASLHIDAVKNLAGFSAIVEALSSGTDSREHLTKLGYLQDELNSVSLAMESLVSCLQFEITKSNDGSEVQFHGKHTDIEFGNELPKSAIVDLKQDHDDHDQRDARKDLLRAEMRIDTLEVEQRALQDQNHNLRAEVEGYRALTSAEQAAVQEHKKDLKTQMAFLKQYEGQLMAKRRTLVADQEALWEKQQNIKLWAAELEDRSAALNKTETRQNERQKTQTETAFRLYLKEQRLEEQAIALRHQEDACRAYQGMCFPSLSTTMMSPADKNNEVAQIEHGQFVHGIQQPGGPAQKAVC